MAMRRATRTARCLLSALEAPPSNSHKPPAWREAGSCTKFARYATSCANARKSQSPQIAARAGPSGNVPQVAAE
eukprot:9089459-Lingulodinium_polyedra.AAC.1